MHRLTSGLLKLTALTALVLCSLALTAAGTPPRYEGDSLTIKKVELQTKDTLKITFSTMPETLWYCPGVTLKSSDKGLELTFLKTHFKRKGKPQYKATPIKDSIFKFVTIPTHGKPVFIREGTTLRQLHPSIAR